MKKNLFTYLSNITLIIGGALGLYVLIDFIVRKSRLPAGACPLTDNKPLIITAIVFLAISFVFSVAEQRQKKKAGLEKHPDDADGTDIIDRDGAKERSCGTGEADGADRAGGTEEPDTADDENKQ